MHQVFWNIRPVIEDKERVVAAEEAAQAVDRLMQVRERILAELRKVIVGQEEVIEQILMALFTGGHCLIIGVPGLAKTLIVRSLAEILDLRFSRIQFTPDLMPSDILGTEIIQEDSAAGSRVMRFVKGPIFGNLILADEINRTPPKTQAALLQAMQELKVTAGGTTYEMNRPFLVLATQNPIEQEGTYPLPEAQLDRFMFNIQIGYPSEDEEVRVIAQTTSTGEEKLEQVADGAEMAAMQAVVRAVPAAEAVVRYAVRLARASRPEGEGVPEFVGKWVKWGVGPRAGQCLILGGKAAALFRGGHHVSCQDIQRVAAAVLRHRIITNFHAEAEGVGVDEIIRRLLESVPLPAGA